MSSQDLDTHQNTNTMMMITDITLSQIPDLSLSETSQVSFQIPTDTDSPRASAGLLLADRSDGFELLRRAADGYDGGGVEGVDDSFAALATGQIWTPHRLPPGRGTGKSFRSQSPLTLDHLTPKVESRFLSLSRGSPPSGHDNNQDINSTPHAERPLGHHTAETRRTTPGATSQSHDICVAPLLSEDRLAFLRAEVNTFDEHDDLPMPTCADSEPPSCHHSDLPPLSTQDAVLADAVQQDAGEEEERESSLPQRSSENHEHSVPDPNSNLDLNPRTKTKTNYTSKPKLNAVPKNIVNSKIPAPKKAHIIRPVQHKGKSQPSATSSTHAQPAQSRASHLGDEPPTIMEDIDNPERTTLPVNLKDGTSDHTAEVENHFTRSSLGGGVAERLVSYSQNLLSSIGLYKSTSAFENNLATGREDKCMDGVRTGDGCASDAVRVPCVVPAAPRPFSPSPPPPSPSQSSSAQTMNVNVHSGNGQPLRLSELSPRKALSQDDDELELRANTPSNGGMQQGDSDRWVKLASPSRLGKKCPNAWMDVDADHGVPSGVERPLRLSELSPRKALRHDDDDEKMQIEIGPSIYPPREDVSMHHGQYERRVVIMSPMRPGKKRQSTSMSISMDANMHMEDETGSPENVQEQGLRPSKKGKTMTSSQPGHSESQDDHRPLTLPNARKKYKPQADVSATVRGGLFLGSASGSSSRRGQGRSKRAEASSSTSKRMTRSSRRERSGVELPLAEKPQNVAVPHMQLTKPVAFTFRVDARLEARKGGEERGFGKITANSELGRLQRSAPHFTHSDRIPEIQAFHHSHPLHEPYAHAPHKTYQSSTSTSTSTSLPSLSHKENQPHHPVVALPFTFATSQRAEERARFDLYVRLKAEEAERAREAERHAREEEEEREVKEMRKRMVPKAREVPGWYAERRAKVEVSTREEGGD